MSFEHLELKYKYRSSQDQIYQDFYQPCLQEAVRYDRAVGYFTSNSLSVLANGLDVFLEKNGVIRIIANPHLTKEDVDAIEFGYKAKEDVVIQSLLRELEMSKKTIETDAFNTLAWLIYKDKLEIKIAFTKNNSLYHEKFGIFFDEVGNRIAFSGSANETVGGIRDNFEKIDVFFKDHDLERIGDMEKDFENLWNDTTPSLKVIEIPNIIKEKLASYRTNHKPGSSFKKVIKPRPYQEEAIQSIQVNNWHGILEMATGTGKTITSLLISKAFLNDRKRMFLVIIVPFTHLVEQWIENCEMMGFSTITKCYGSKKTWMNQLQADIRDFNLGIIDHHVAITTYKTAASKEFNNYIAGIKRNAFLIADECHYFGVRSLRKNLLGDMDAKVGLSATPQRWWDDDGTDYITAFFGPVVYEYDMKTAIRNGALTEYSYHPIQTDLTDHELHRYDQLTKRLIHLYSDEKLNNEEISEVNRKRSLLISKAEAKKEKLFSLFDQKDRESVKHTLVYCAPGEIEGITKGLADLGYRVHRFDSEVSLKERMKILDAFDRGSIQILVAIKCLDEGVDVPSTKEAYFLASTSNPREFVQRRGRILRAHPGKNIAKIYDFIVLPSIANDQMYKSIASKELPRFSEFSRFAINSYRARQEIGAFLAPYHLEYLMDKLPWEVYNEFKQMEGPHENNQGIRSTNQ
ncbi:Superfamily II DNA or RNA helicase [Oceanobacillus limi]|uniref:Superfamily II DNA or RNA helicase n=1 Tax=Oceanobacillus limi TaxID=930131 RepID=A0A1I0FGJ1_9BACI|nr:DEAD/DEAH box helicase family protein [Oceanobacillus limi]SET57411.1 Superfamily II DNA or RNA helicase [Oceanobacillus limi]